MAFLLYHIDQVANCFRLQQELRDRLALWGAGGAVATCARGSLADDGPWCVTERQLLGQILPLLPDRSSASGDASEYTILDDLVPRGPEFLFGRLLEVKGILDHGFNPILLTFEEVLSIKRDDPRCSQEAAHRKRFTHAIPVPTPPRERIRTFHYLLNSWRPPGRFGGVLLRDPHWDALVGSN